MSLPKSIAALAAMTMVVGLAACGDDEPKAQESTQPTSAGGAEFTPAAADTFSVQVSLPAPGWWNGDDPDSLDGGFEYAMAQEIGKRLGMTETTIENVDFGALVAGQTGDATKFDLALSEVTITDERAEVVDFTVSYFSADQGVMVNEGTEVTQDNLKSLEWGVQTSTTGQTFVTDQIQPDTEAAAYDDLAVLFQALEAGEVDAIMMDTVILLPQADKQNALVAAQFKTGEQYGGIVPKGSSNLDAINEVIQEMIDDGTLAGFASQYLEPEFQGDPTSVPYLEAPAG